MFSILFCHFQISYNNHLIFHKKKRYMFKGILIFLKKDILKDFPILFYIRLLGPPLLTL